jgi:hypothetical protein
VLDERICAAARTLYLTVRAVQGELMPRALIITGPGFQDHEGKPTFSLLDLTRSSPRRRSPVTQRDDPTLETLR